MELRGANIYRESVMICRHARSVLWSPAWPKQNPRPCCKSMLLKNLATACNKLQTKQSVRRERRAEVREDEMGFRPPSEAEGERCRNTSLDFKDSTATLRLVLPSQIKTGFGFRKQRNRKITSSKSEPI